MADKTVNEQLRDLDAERGVLGSLLVDPDAILKVADRLTPDDFTDERHQHIYGAIYALYTQQAGIDYLTVVEQARLDGHASTVQMPYLVDLVNATPTALIVNSHARVVYRLATLRRLFFTGAKITQLAYGTRDDLDEVFEQARALLDAASPVHSDGSLMLWLDSLRLFMDRQQKRLTDNEERAAGQVIPLAWMPWDGIRRMIEYLELGMLAVVAAASSVGKTTFMECCAEYWAKLGLRVAFFHFELTHQVMMDRRMARLSGVSIGDIRAGYVDGRMQGALEAMEEWKGGITYVHCPGWTAERVVAAARKLQARGLCDVVIIDYLQKVRLVGRAGQNEASWIANTVEAFKTMAEQLAVPVLLGSQLNREGQRFDRKTAAAIRGSGEVEEKANYVITLDRAILDEPARNEQGRIVADEGDRSPEVRVRVDKNTMGTTGECEMVINGARFLMLDVAQAAESDDLNF